MYDDVREILVEKMSERLYQLALSHNYPLAREVGVMALLEGMSSAGVNVEISDHSQSMSFTLGMWDPQEFEAYNFSNSLSIDEALEGYRLHPVGSNGSLHETVSDFFSELRSNAPDTIKGTKFARNIVDMNRKAHAAVDTSIRDNIRKKRDSVFLNRILTPADYSYSSQLIEEVLAKQNLSFYRRAVELYEGSNAAQVGSPWPHELLQKNWSRFHKTYWPSPACLERFHWGLYLDELARIKGYDVDASPFSRREHLVREGSEALTKGLLIRWGELAT